MYDNMLQAKVQRHRRFMKNLEHYIVVEQDSHDDELLALSKQRTRLEIITQDTERSKSIKESK